MIVDSLIEIPSGSKNKYEIDKKLNRIRLDRVLYSSVSYPAEYGYIIDTLADDGDALDILVLSSSATFPGCLVEARVLGYLDMIDKGQYDQKVISVNEHDPRFEDIRSLDDVPNHIKREIKEFFKTYKDLQDVEVKIGEFHGYEETVKLIEECRQNYIKNQKNIA